MSDRISWNICRDTATSAIWKVSLPALVDTFGKLRKERRGVEWARDVVTHNPVKGVKRPKAESGEGKTPAIGNHQARELLAAPRPGDRQEQARPRRPVDAALSALRREELCKLSGQGFPATRGAASRI